MIKTFILILAAFVSGCASTIPPVNAQKDNALVGSWLGERSPGSECAYASWETTRDPEGSFVISFYSDKERTVFTGHEYGYWWTKGGIFNVQLPRLKDTADAYRYDVENDGSEVLFREIQGNGSSCGKNYQFRDVKVDP